jgi:hypothetical protein
VIRAALALLLVLVAVPAEAGTHRKPARANLYKSVQIAPMVRCTFAAPLTAFYCDDKAAAGDGG